jgi:RsiW-degrading membrane proteinase PrsW (M82 family)
VLLLVGLLGFVGVAVAAEKLFGLDRPLELPGPVALLLLLVPALLWLGFFYLQDRHEPEPKHYVLGVFLLGAFVAYPVAGWISALAPVPAWEGQRLSAANVLAAVLPLGLAQEAAKYLVVRYSVYVSDEFDEPMDGIIYMTAAGIGFATAENIDRVTTVGAMHLGAFAVNAVVTTLAHGSIAGVLGYALGVARFGPAQRRAPLVLAGLLIAAALNGGFGLLEALVRVDGMHVAPWRGVAFAAGFAACVFGATLVLMRRHLALSPARASHV